MYPSTGSQPLTSTPPSVMTSWITATAHPHIKQTNAEAFVTPFQYNPYKNGAKNDPARAPQETPIICAINVTSGCASLKIAITADTKIKNTINTLITNTCFFSDISFLDAGLITSSVNVELDVSTSDERVDIDADNTSTMTTAMTSAGSVDNMVGTMVSNSGFPVAGLMVTLSAYSLPNPPRK